MFRTMKALAIACCFVVGALPFGQVPNFVGRCGQKLCHCRIEKSQKNSSQPQMPASPKRFLTLTNTSLSGAEDTIALQDVCSTFIAPAIPDARVVVASAAPELDLQYHSPTPPSFISELSTPPPRHNA